MLELQIMKQTTKMRVPISPAELLYHELQYLPTGAEIEFILTNGWQNLIDGHHPLSI